MSNQDNTLDGLRDYFYVQCPFALAMQGKPLSDLDQSQIEWGQEAGADLDVDRLIIQMHGEDARWQHMRMKAKAMAAWLNGILIRGHNSDGTVKLPAAAFGTPPIKRSFVAGKDFDCSDEMVREIVPEGTIVDLHKDHRMFFTPVKFVDLGELDYRPVHRVRMVLDLYVMKEN